MFNAGDKVLVALPPRCEAITRGMRQYNQTQMVVKDVYTFSGAGLQDVTLYGARSAVGMDYHFLSEWLVPLEEGAEK